MALKLKNPNIPEKCIALIGLGAAVGMKCDYSIHALRGRSKKAEANEEEIKLAVQQAAIVQYVRILLYGSRIDYDKFLKGKFTTVSK